MQKRRRPDGNTAEFPVALMLLLLVGVFPVLDLLFCGVAACCTYFAANQICNRAASQRTYAEALNAAADEARVFNNSGFAAFARMAPVSGYSGSGMDLFVAQTSTDVGNAIKKWGPNTPVADPIDKNAFVYEYATKVEYDVSPLVKMDGLPFISSIPGLGTNYKLSMTAHRAAEYPLGLSGPGSALALKGGSAPKNLRSPGIQTMGFVADPESEGWRTPNIYDMIKQSGRKIVTQDVLIIDSRSFNWTPTSLNVPTGAQIWVDYKADGAWNVKPSDSPVDFDANGQTICPDSPFPCGMMIGKVGLNGSPFALGVDQWNFPLPGSGTLYMGCKEGSNGITPSSIGLSEPGQPQPPLAGTYGDRADNRGTMTVRVIITQ